MRRLFASGVILAALSAAAGCATSVPPPRAVYGSAPSMAFAPLTLARALSEANVGRTLAVTGRVAEVCQMKGCWMVLTDDRETVRITFKDYAFFVPRDLAGQTVVAEGILSRKILTEEEARHLAAESDGSTSPAAGPREEWALLASSVVVPP